MDEWGLLKRNICVGGSMFVRVYDKDENSFFKSIVYGYFGEWYCREMIVFNPGTKCFQLIENMYESGERVESSYEIINDNTEEWVSYEKVFLLKLKKYFKEHGAEWSINSFSGYQEVFDNYEFLLRIVQKKKVPLAEANIVIRENEDVDTWNYIRTQEDANEFMRLFVGFHDSTLNKLEYKEEAQTNQLNVIFDNSGWYGVVELCFEGLIAMNLRPVRCLYYRELYDATLLINDESVFWADSRLEEENLNCAPSQGQLT